jgi:hypothetical protein
MRSNLQSFSTFAVRRCAPALCLLAFSVCASASIVTFTGEDLDAGPISAHPNSNAADGSFNAAALLLGNISTINFETAPLGAFTSLSVASGVTLTGANVNGGQQQILNAPDFPPNPALGGFNITPAGFNYADMQGGTLTFTFATPTQFFGAFLTGIQTSFFQDTFTFSDGTSESINVPGVGTTSSSGALDFVGFTDAGKSISSVTITASVPGSEFDAIGVDGVEYQSVATTPEPDSMLLVFSGMASLGMMYRRLRVGRV